MDDLRNGESFRSYRLQSILNLEIAAGNYIAKTTFAAGKTVVILEVPYMVPIIKDNGVVVYGARDLGEDVFGMSYSDVETNEILACFLRKNIIEKLGGGAVKRAKKIGKWFKDEAKRIKHDTFLR